MMGKVRRLAGSVLVAWSLLAVEAMAHEKSEAQSYVHKIEEAGKKVAQALLSGTDADVSVQSQHYSDMIHAATKHGVSQKEIDAAKAKGDAAIHAAQKKQH